MHRKVAATLVAALALGVASCGGTERTETVSRAELISRLESACRAGQREAAKQARDRRAAFLEVLIANLTTIDDHVGRLETTGEAKADFEDYKDTVRSRLDALRQIAAADAADRQRLVRAQRPAIGAASIRARAAIVRLGARHICV